MKNSWLLNSLVVAIAISLSACAKKESKGSVDEKPATPPAKQQGTTLPAPTPTNVGKPDITKSLPDPCSKEELEKEKNPNKKHLKEKVCADNKKPTPPPAGGEQKPPAGTPPPAGGNANNPPVTAPKPPKKQITQDEIQMMLADGDRYSAAAQDSLRTYLSLMLSEEKDEVKKAKSVKLAYEITSASLKYNALTGRYHATVNFGDKSVGLIGDLTAQETSMAENVKGFEGTIQCMDQYSDEITACETSVLTLKKSGAKAQIIFRSTPVAWIADFPPRNCITSECQKIFDMLLQTERKVIHPNTLALSTMETFEVVNGKSGFSVIAISNENQVIKIAGPLANPAMYETLNTPTQRTLTADELKDSHSGALRSTQIHDSMNDITIVRNLLSQEESTLNLMVQMAVQKDGERDHFHLRLQRKAKPIRAFNLPTRISQQ